jgi:hypothetical protein
MRPNESGATPPAWPVGFLIGVVVLVALTAPFWVHLIL